MRLHLILLTALICAGCGGSNKAGQVAKPAQPQIYRTIIEAEGIPFEISWDRNDRTRATARVFGFTDGTTRDPTGIIVQATGCKVTSVPALIATDDGVPTYVADTDCAPAQVLNERDAVVSRDLAREIDLAVALVSQEPQAIPTPTPVANDASELPPAELYEGSPFIAFTATDIERYCAESWTTRVGADGRTEYNPCKRRDVFR